MNNHQENMTLYNAHFIDSLVRSGLKNAVISPGSRSTPMALLMEEHPDLTTYIQVDERSAGFFALGLAKSQQQPVALLCTSGTAAANYMPAVAEADISRVPLVVLTSDRPPELRDVGAPQTIDQIHLYGHTAKWFAEMALPESNDTALRYVRTQGARAVFESMAAPKGPVHLNFPYREPLLPDYDGIYERIQIPSPVQFNSGKKIPDSGLIDDVAKVIHGKKGVIVAGEIVNIAVLPSILALSEKIGWPIIADPLSQLRSSTDVIDSYDAFLRDDDIKDSLKPEAIIRFGALPVSKSLMLYMKRHNDVPHIIVDEDGAWRDPSHIATHMVCVNEAVFCNEMTAALPEQSSEWASLWREVNEASRSIMKTADGMDEGALFGRFLQSVPEGASIFTGNSMPIRDLDSFLFAGEQRFKLHGNRGANGIDGLVSTALGIAASGEKVYAVMGDLSFFHDVNGLLGAKMNGLSMTVLVMNNNGGGIFSYLPQSGEEKHYERLFGTPAGLQFEHAAALYGCHYVRISSREQLAKELNESREGVTILEAFTNRAANTSIHRSLWKQAVEQAKKVLRNPI
ncbi:2-succinyl-5-enolpyruvyl-6-hydroxy-3-cyclohexene-1-carboxylic-acid synthase [Domibacillus epiphyticus]|uniref:2-succinyl-5-enolpyruvyl-6-hydroxy-3-cyclohexene-1-carboxylate synthase n=1 Tax=Domibacillus epiphyticus TaxID=1714355 RepID=A0A1V2A8Y4_9BACI|nr:2-succinyl-5-enolpyruvyl-6-hydroxy-3-cyclohexene-1-carboxylic-acid synthase [Domibacillus epiphyticus]OMP67390.1 2-succinyl-5-enolpyruvyl-6-hydroxy-3-cyclohexene-1-carboxylic-acid synthase [Domibacillus epiphyticus]